MESAFKTRLWRFLPHLATRSGQFLVRLATQFWRFLLRHVEPAIEGAIHLCGWSAILFVFSIFAFIFFIAAHAFGKLDWGEFFFSTEWQPDSVVKPHYGTLALLVGTLSVTGLAMALAAPLGLGTAVFISEFCHGKVKESLKVLVELSAAIPSIVWGFVGYMVLAPLIIRFTGARSGSTCSTAA